MNQLDFEGNFPYDRYPVMRAGQKMAFAGINADRAAKVFHTVIEAPVGSGKTGIGYTYLRACEEAGVDTLHYLVPNKTQAEQVKQLHPDVHVVYGRNEHPCLYYPEEKLQADEIPCSMLRDCPHRVHQETGETHVTGAVPCSYLLQKFEAKQAGITVCTDAFFYFNTAFARVEEDEERTGALVIDEVQQLARAIRSVLSTDLTDWKLERAALVLRSMNSALSAPLEAFITQMKKLIDERARGRKVLLEQDEVGNLYDLLHETNSIKLRDEMARSIKEGLLNPLVPDDREILQQMEDLAHSLKRFQRGLRYSMPRPEDGQRGKHPLSYVLAFGTKEPGEKRKVQYCLTVRDYYVAPLLKRLLPENVLAYSATIGDSKQIEFETSIAGGFHSIPSSFPIENARIYLPTDTFNLSQKGARRQDKTKMLRRMARACVEFAGEGLRSLVIVVSQEEREKFLMLAKEEGLNTVSYGKGVRAREAATQFRAGQGDCLVGTVANYGEGLDLPGGIAPVTFYLRPAYPRPDDPATQFEERRYGNRRWAIWNWRVVVEMLQVRGRNIRSETDLGVTFLVSQQFNRFTYGALPAWLRPAYRGKLTFEECIDDAKSLLLRSEEKAA